MPDTVPARPAFHVPIHDAIGFTWFVAFWWFICFLVSRAFNPVGGAAAFVFVLLFYFGGVVNSFPSPLHEPIFPKHLWPLAIALGLMLGVAGTVASGSTARCLLDCSDTALAWFADITYDAPSVLGQTILPGRGGLHEEFDFVLGAAWLYGLGLIVAMSWYDITLIAKYVGLPARRSSSM